MSQFDNIVNDQLVREDAERHLLGDLLRRYGSGNNEVCAFAGHMANTRTFLFEESLAWIATNVRLAIDMPFMADHKDDDGNVVINGESIDNLVQRPVDWTRQETLARYLVSEPMHMFPPLLLVVTSPWVDNPDAPEWIDGRASRSTYDYTVFGSFPGFGVINLDPASFQIYALDGQHRVIGIRGAVELVQTGMLQPKDKTGKAKGDPVQIKDWLVDGANAANSLLGETIGIKLIPAVIEGETAKEASDRIAGVFVHVNQTSRPLKEGELAQIDPSDGYSIVARTIATEHPFLKKEPGCGARVNFSNNTVALRSTVFTTLATVKRMSRHYLESDPAFAAWSGKAQRSKTLAKKPQSDEIALAEVRISEFWDEFASLPSLTKLDPPTSASTGEFRRLPTDTDPGLGHLLFRPVGQQLLAEAVGRVLHDRVVGLSLTEIFTILGEYDTRGGFEIAEPANPWYGVLFSPSGSNVLVKGQNLGADLLVYMLGGYGTDTDQIMALRSSFARARQSRDGFSFGFDGDEVLQLDLKLPGLLNTKG